MPLEPRHGQRIPSGRRVALLMARLLASMRRSVQRQIRAGKRPTLEQYQPVIVQMLTPLFSHEYSLGAEYTRRRIRQRMQSRRRHKNMPPLINAATMLASGKLPENPLQFAWDLFRPEAVIAAQRQAMILAGYLTQTIYDEVRTAIQAGIVQGEGYTAIADRIKPTFGADRALTIGMTESSRAMHEGQLQAARSSGVVAGLTWLASADACEKCEELNGKTVALGEPFYVDPKGGPYATVYYPPRHPHCMCAVLEKLK